MTKRAERNQRRLHDVDPADFLDSEEEEVLAGEDYPEPDQVCHRWPPDPHRGRRW